MIEWRKIPGFSRYSVSERGDVRRDVMVHRSPPGQCSAVPNDRGYIKTSLTGDDGRHRTITVHTLVALAFLGPRPPGLFICHGDQDRTNNHHRNLRYDTPRANTRDTMLVGAHCHGASHPHAKLSDDKAKEIIALCRRGELTQAQIGARYGVSQRAVWNVLHGVRWKHIQARAA